MLLASETLKGYFGDTYPALYAATKEAEYDAFEAEMPLHEFDWYLLAD